MPLKAPKVEVIAPIVLDKTLLKPENKVYDLEPVYTSPIERLANEYTENKQENRKRLWRVRDDSWSKSPWMFIYDDSERITKANQILYLDRVDGQEADQIVLILPPKIVGQICRILADEWGVQLGEGAGTAEIAKALVGKGALLKPTSGLHDPSVISLLLQEQWSQLVEDCIAFRTSVMDDALKTIRKAHLLRGILPKYNPHALLITDSQVGKTSYYKQRGISIDRASAKSFTGTVGEKKEKLRSALHQNSFPVCVDEILEQDDRILQYLLNYMERGEILTTLASNSVDIEGKSTIIGAGNPSTSAGGKAAFLTSLNKYGNNLLAMGSRIGIIYYSKHNKKPERGNMEEEEWHMKHEIFKAIEEELLPVVTAVFHQEVVHKWLNQPIQEYTASIESLLESLHYGIVKDFLRTQAENGYRHMRGAALNCAVVDNMLSLRSVTKSSGPLIIKQDVVDTLIATANKYLLSFVEINRTSVEGIIQDAPRAAVIERESAFADIPMYQRLLVKIVARRTKRFIDKGLSMPNSVPLSKGYTYLTAAEKSSFKLSDLYKSLRNNPRETYNSHFQRYFGFKVIKYIGHPGEYLITAVLETGDLNAILSKYIG